MRLSENLNLALAELLDRDPRLRLLGEDIADPYGGAFKVTAGLSTRFPDRVISTPLSEGGIVGVASGLALAGDAAVVEIMFADFVALAFDQIVNFASKSVSMYGRRLPMPVLVRCPTGAGRGYGPTHSQSLQKHFIGVPGLSVYEMSPFHDNRPLLAAVLERAEPAVFFEDKRLYPHPLLTEGTVDDLFRHDLTEGPADERVARVYADDPQTADCVLIAPGGMVPRALAAMRSLLIESEISCLLLVPSRLYPLDLEPLLPLLRRAPAIAVAEDGTPGGTWGGDIAARLHRLLWGELRRPVTLVNAEDSVIPVAAHLENRVVVRDSTIHRAIAEACRG